MVVCGDEVARTKPHPEPYLTAAARLLGVPIGAVRGDRGLADRRGQRARRPARGARRAGEVALTDPDGVHQVDSLELLDVPGAARRFVAGQAAA